MNERKKSNPVETVETLSLGETTNTGQAQLTMEDYRAHMQGWQAGVAGHQADEKGSHQYRIGFGVGRELRTSYATSLKNRVVQ